MRVIFFGSGEFGLPTLKWLRDHHQLVAVVSQPDRPAGRNRQLTPTPIAKWTSDAGAPLHRVENANEPAFVEALRQLGGDVGVVIAFGQKLSPELIAASGKLVVNLHASLLPAYRGAAPINRAVIDGKTTTGVSVIALAQKMDAGMVYATSAINIDPSCETAGEVHDRLAALGPAAIEEVMEKFARGTLTGAAQDETQATKAPKLSKADAWVDFDYDAFFVAARIHGLTPWPGVRVIWEKARDGTRQEMMLHRVAAEPDLSCFIGGQGHPHPGTMTQPHRVAVRDGVVRLVRVQTPGKRVMHIDEFLRGHTIEPGDRLLRP